MKNAKQRVGCLLTAWALCMSVSLLLVHSTSAQTVDFTGVIRAHFICNVTSNSETEHAVLSLYPTFKGRYLPKSVKKLLSDAFYCSNNLPCFCTYNIDASSRYKVDANGVGQAQVAWVPDASNDVACTGPFAENWAFVLDDSGIIMRLISDNNGNTNQSGTGVCNQAPGRIDP